MKKIVTSALIGATAVAALSACSSSGVTNGKAAQTITTGSTTEAPTTVASTTKTPAAVASTTKTPPPTVASTTKAATTPKYTVAEQNAITSAQDYLGISGFSRAGLIEQLSSTAGDGFKVADATFAVDHIKVNWNAEAVESAKAYLQIGGFSRASLIEQLSSSAGDKYTLAQATYAANHVGL